MKTMMFALLLGVVSGCDWKTDQSAEIRDEIAKHEKNRDVVKAEIARLRAQLEKVNNSVSQHEAMVEELQAKLETKKNP